MTLPVHLQSFTIGNQQFSIVVPEDGAIQQLYHNNRSGAYWARVWPASIGLCLFLEAHPHYILSKNILELAAGLGLPGLYASKSATHVCITDREPQAVDCVLLSVKHMGSSNITAATLDWKDAVNAPLPDVLLLSDVNYEPPVFEELLKMIRYFLQKKVTVIISTPQRLVAKDFINNLLPSVTQEWHTGVSLYEKETPVSIFVLES